jgi:hypothetical protein
MREDTTRYEQSRTDPIPAPADEPGFVDGRTDGAAPPAGHPDAEPGYTDAAYADIPPDQDMPPASGQPGFADQATAPEPQHTADTSTEDSGAVLFGGEEVERFRAQWRDLQAGFVDNPKEAVQGADRLVEDVLRSLTDVFNAHKQELETQWQGGETEELRVALRRYRSFFDQLLNT